ncbi:hypothetical protein DS2_04880 [Catenovulum agarivorans DS-2]|uniref:Glutamine synthetase n=1 Tax=Catenovulum agarivorans DS-2 TaxID=1328313 RepID=W7QTI9_9ALTE|nr:DUF2959 domain-containing protein [Catenovulum agarivorans]EWH11163.1 hypothetical protein DS2_04880 [Catenovulum agarivorans DS-2]
MQISNKLIVLCFALTLSACQSAYYSAMEKVGYHKRDILVDRVEDVQNAQQEAQQEFKSALEQFQSVIAFDGGGLQARYEQLNDEYEASKSAAEAVSNHIDKVEDVAEDLFDEWQDELEQYSSARLRSQSATKLAKTKSRYKTLLRAMRQSESKMQPFLSALQDNVLFLKHNLNAQAVGALKGELAGIERDVQAIIKEIDRSIKESEKFINSLNAN